MTSVVIIIIIIISLIRQVGRNWMALSVAAHLSVCLSVCPVQAFSSRMINLPQKLLLL